MSLKKVAIDLRSLDSATGKRGIGYYTFNLMEKVLSLPHPDIGFILYTTLGSRTSNRLKIDVQDRFYRIPTLLHPVRGLRRLDPIFSSFWQRALDKSRPDLVHIIYLFDLFYTAVLDQPATVVTVYDLTPLIFKEHFFSKQKAFDWYLQKAGQLKKAKRIIAISQSAKRDLVTLLRIPEDKISVVYGSISSHFRPVKNARAIVAKRYGIKRPFLLSVGAFSYHKNIPRLFEAFASYLALKKNRLDLVVVCKLTGREEAKWRDLLGRLNISEYVHLTNFVADSDLPTFYSASDALIFPSLYEGFGLPILEAMACGTPVITSNTSSMPEAGGDAALYVNPEKTEEITAAIDKLLGDQALKDKLVEKGFKQVRRFSWQKAAEETLEIYREVLKS